MKATVKRSKSRSNLSKFYFLLCKWEMQLLTFWLLDNEEFRSDAISGLGSKDGNDMQNQLNAMYKQLRVVTIRV